MKQKPPTLAKSNDVGKKAATKATLPYGYTLEFIIEKVIANEKESRQWAAEHGFNPANFEKEIELLSSKYPDISMFFWQAACEGLDKYLLVNKKIKIQKRNTRNLNWLKSCDRQVMKLRRNIHAAVEIGLIEPVDIRIKVPKDMQALFESNPFRHKNLGKPINALAITMARDLHKYVLPKKEALNAVLKFIELYLPEELVDSQTVRRALYRK